MFTHLLITLVVVIVLFVVVVATRRADFSVTRSTSVAAPAGVVFAQVNSFRKWDAWSPWAKLDPAMKQTHEGATTGAGAIYSWAGNSKVGAGRMTIIESRAVEQIRIKLEFLKPFVAVNTTEFNFQSDGNQTRLTWSMTDRNNFMAKAFGLFMNMDKLVGGDFERGLAQLKAFAEAAARTLAAHPRRAKREFSQEQREVFRVVERLIRHESSKLVASLTRSFGITHLPLDEDFVSTSILKIR